MKGKKKSVKVGDLCVDAVGLMVRVKSITPEDRIFWESVKATDDLTGPFSCTQSRETFEKRFDVVNHVMNAA